MNRGVLFSAATFFTILISGLAILSSPAVNAAEPQAELAATHDTTVSELSPDATLADSSTITLNANPASSGLVRFEVSGVPDGATASSATLAVRVLSGDAEGSAVHLVAGDWDDSTTYASAPGVGERVAALSGVSLDGGWVQVDLGDIVAGNGTYDFYLVAGEGEEVIIASSESGEGPRLLLSWDSTGEVIHDPFIEPEVEPVPGADLDPNPFEVPTPEQVTLPELGSLSALTAASNSSTTLTATADATTYSDARTTNRGSNTRLYVDGSPQRRILLRFDLSSVPSNANVTSARLRLYTLDSSSNAGSVYRVSGSWSESSVTWSNAPSAGSRVANIGKVSAGSWATVDVTSAIGSSNTLDLYVISTNTNGADFGSSESSSRPQLIVEWGSGSSPAPAPTPNTNNSGCEPVPSSRLNLLNERAGFGRDVTGGSGGCLYTVTNNRDDGPGSLRWAAERGGYWIVFDGNYTIRLDKAIDVAGNTTIDGRGQNVTIERGGLYILRPDSNNVILSHLTIQNGLPREDLVQVRKGATRFWLHHLTLRGAYDEFIDIGSPSSAGITGTISWTRFEPTNGAEMVLIIGDDNNEHYNNRIYVTVHHNYYAGTNSRHPLITGAKLHSYNNVYQWLRWGMQVRTGAGVPSEVVSERDIFDGRGSRQPGRAIHRESGTNHVRVTGALLMNGASMQNPTSYGTPSRAFTPPYGYNAETANQSLFDRVTSGAGNR